MTRNESPTAAHASGTARGAAPYKATTTPRTTQWAGAYEATAAAKRGSTLQSPTDAPPASPRPSPPAASTKREPSAVTAVWLASQPARDRQVESTGSARPA